MEGTILLPQTMPRVSKGHVPDGWKPFECKTVNKFFDNLHTESLKRAGGTTNKN